MYEVLKNFSFELSTRIEYGIGKSKNLKNELKKLNISKTLIVTDKGIKEAGLINKITKQLKDSNIEYKIFDEVEPNPKDHNVEKGAEKAKEFNAESIVAIGGGSPIDCAKSIGVLLSHKKDKIKKFEGTSSINKTSPPLITIPTTAGTGSEVTHSSVITDTENEYKMTIKSTLIAPKIALMDPELTKTMPQKITASTGLDALTHAIEAYTCKEAQPLSDAAALYAIELISKYLTTAYKNGEDIEARSGMLLGSLLAGIAFSHSDVASVHSMAEALGGLLDAPHGVCNSVLLPYVMEYNMDQCEEKYAEIGRRMKSQTKHTEEGATKAIKKVKTLSRKVNLPKFRELGVEKEDLPELARMSAQNISTESNPKQITKEEYHKLFKKALNE